MIDVIDAGIGNIQSVVNMIRRAGGDARIVHAADDISTSSKIVLPGVGAFDRGMAGLRERGLDGALHEAVGRGAWVLGLCLGMQLLFERSEEGVSPGLGLVPGTVIRFRPEDPDLKVPHMGWNHAAPTRASVLFPSLDEEYRFYFVHSFYVQCRDEENVTAVTRHGIDFACAIEHGSVLGVQFHPEKSHRFGMALFSRFEQVAA